MAVRTRSELIGSEELRRKLLELDEAVRQETLSAAVSAGAALIVNEAKRRAPYRTGTLRRAIHARIEATKTEAHADIGVHQEGEDGVVPYAAQVEFGGTIVPKNASVLHWVDADGNHHFARSVTQEARPYLRPAFDEQSEPAMAEIAAALGALIERVGS